MTGIDRSIIIRSTLEGANDCGADCPHRAAARTAVGDRVRQRLWDFEMFAVHWMLIDWSVVHRSKGARSHLEIERGDCHATVAQCVEHRGGEVQTGRGG